KTTDLVEIHACVDEGMNRTGGEALLEQNWKFPVVPGGAKSGDRINEVSGRIVAEMTIQGVDFRSKTKWQTQFYGRTYNIPVGDRGDGGARTGDGVDEI